MCLSCLSLIGARRPVVAKQAERRSEKVELRADKMTVAPVSCSDNEQQPKTAERRTAPARCGSQIALSGAVKLRWRGFQLRTQQAAIRVDRQGNPQQLSSSGGVSFEDREGRRGTAARLAADMSARRLVFSGAVRLVTAEGLLLEGDQIIVDLRNGSARVTRARVTLSPKDGQ